LTQASCRPLVLLPASKKTTRSLRVGSLNETVSRMALNPAGRHTACLGQVLVSGNRQFGPSSLDARCPLPERVSRTAWASSFFRDKGSLRPILTMASSFSASSHRLPSSCSTLLTRQGTQAAMRGRSPPSRGGCGAEEGIHGQPFFLSPNGFRVLWTTPTRHIAHVALNGKRLDAIVHVPGGHAGRDPGFPLGGHGHVAAAFDPALPQPVATSRVAVRARPMEMPWTRPVKRVRLVRRQVGLRFDFSQALRASRDRNT